MLLSKASNLLILDEFGYQPLDREAANLLFRVVNYRYQRGSIALSTNKGITSWPEVLGGDEVLAGAILDRLLPSATVLNIQGRSYRPRDMEASIGQVASSPSGKQLDFRSRLRLSPNRQGSGSLTSSKFGFSDSIFRPRQNY